MAFLIKVFGGGEVSKQYQWLFEMKNVSKAIQKGYLHSSKYKLTTLYIYIQYSSCFFAERDSVLEFHETVTF